MAEACRVVLIGMMGSGKTSVGRLLAVRTGWPYHDNDQLLRKTARATPREILEASGEGALRQAEIKALRTGLTSPEPCVVGAAAGVIVDAGARRLVAEAGLVVWLRAEPEALHARAAGAAHRPWPSPDRLGWMRAAVAKRNPLYASVADVTLDTDTASPAALVEPILDRLAAVDACRSWLRLVHAEQISEPSDRHVITPS